MLRIISKSLKTRKETRGHGAQGTISSSHGTISQALPVTPGVVLSNYLNRTKQMLADFSELAG